MTGTELETDSKLSVKFHALLSSFPVVAMEPFTYKLFPTLLALLDDMSMLFSQIESDTSTDRVWAAQIESALHR